MRLSAPPALPAPTRRLTAVGGVRACAFVYACACVFACVCRRLTVVGLPKTIDNDVYPIKQSLGAMTAAQQGAIFYENVVNEHSANPRMLIVHEVGASPHATPHRHPSG